MKNMLLTRTLSDNFDSKIIANFKLLHDVICICWPLARCRHVCAFSGASEFEGMQICSL